MLKPRPQLGVFASAMEAILKTYDHRGRSLDTIEPGFALNRLWDEMRELDRAAWMQLYRPVPAPTDMEMAKCKNIQKEACDVANFCAMLWWAAERAKGKKSKLATLFTRG